MTKLIYDLDYKELSSAVLAFKQPTYRANQIWQGLYRQFWQYPDDFSTLPRDFRNLFFNDYEICSINPKVNITSNDNLTNKVLFELQDGVKIETVLMRYHKRNTLCISTQSGCAMGCTFCATGQMGFHRNLTSGEIVQQVLFFAQILKSEDEKLTNIVVMGMGEPFHNYDETLKAIYQLNHPAGMNFGARRFTISTVGLIPAIKRFTDEKHQINLAVSLHASTDGKRVQMLPITKKYPIPVLIDACLDYVGTTNRRITFEWALINEINDQDEDAELLADLLRPFFKDGGAGCHVNVIKLNPTKMYNGEPSSNDRVNKFCAILTDHGIPCSLRLRRGIEINAGCGQLAVQIE